MDSNILILTKIESQRKKIFFGTLIIFFFLHLFNVYVRELFVIHAQWMHNIGRDSSSFEVLRHIVSNFSVFAILNSAGKPYFYYTNATGILVGIPLYLLLWFLLPSYLKETNKGWIKIYVAASIFSVFLSLYCLQRNTSNILTEYICEFFFLSIMILVLVVGVRWIFYGFKKIEKFIKWKQ